jgi:hypothetical protein
MRAANLGMRYELSGWRQTRGIILLDKPLLPTERPGLNI